MSDRIEELIKEYAEEAETIHTAKTVGDFTWIGLFASFLAEYINITEKESDG